MGLMFTVQLQAFNRLQTAGQAFFSYRYVWLVLPRPGGAFSGKKLSSTAKDWRTLWKLK